MRPRIPEMDVSTIVGCALVVLGAVACVLHLAFPDRPIGETLIGGIIASGATMMRLPQRAAPSLGVPGPMSTTSTSPASSAAIAGLTSIPALVGVFAGQALSGVNTKIQGDVQTIEQDASTAITELQQKLDAAETSNTLVSTALTAARETATTLGLQLPTEDQLFAAVKQAANDLAAGLKAA